MFSRILSNTKKQISRSGWVGWASVSVMTLAFAVALIFGGLAYVSNLYIQYIESKSNLLVFFEVGMERELIDSLRDKWETDSRIKSITYTTEEQAYEQYSDYTAKVQPEIYEVLKTQEKKTLPSSLDIQIYTLDQLEALKNDLQRDINGELESLIIIPTSDDSDTAESVDADLPISFPSDNQVRYKYSEDPTKPPINLRVDDENLDQLRQVLLSLRIAGLAVITLLFIVIFFFTFMTVEFRLYNQMEEIGVMQLVGGSLFFIRAPYILEGGFYGLVGALLSTTLIGGVLIAVFVLDKTSALSKFVYENFSMLPWPHISGLGWLGLVSLIGLIGFLLGAVISLISIKRYIR